MCLPWSSDRFFHTTMKRFATGVNRTGRRFTCRWLKWQTCAAFIWMLHYAQFYTNIFKIKWFFLIRTWLTKTIWIEHSIRTIYSIKKKLRSKEFYFLILNTFARAIYHHVWQHSEILSAQSKGNVLKVCTMVWYN